MNLSQAIEKHSEWKLRFRSAIQKQDQLDVGTIRRDNCCDLGKWLYGDGRQQFSQLPAYKNCLASHSDFHREAGKVAQTINEGKYQQAEAMLGAGTVYAKTSSAVATAIVQLKKASGL